MRKATNPGGNDTTTSKKSGRRWFVRRNQRRFFFSQQQDKQQKKKQRDSRLSSLIGSADQAGGQTVGNKGKATSLPGNQEPEV